jgi:hypothetical protein
LDNRDLRITLVPHSPALEIINHRPLSKTAFGKKRQGGALFNYGDRIGVADVIFGEEEDSMLLGAFTLEAVGLALDPLRRELKPLPMILAGLQ